MNRRRFLTLLGVSTASGLAGCGGLGGTGSTETETIQETPNNSTVNPAHGTSTPTPTPTPEPTPTPTPTETEVQETEEPDPDLTGREIYFNQIHGEDEGVLERVQGTGGKTSISFQAIDESLEEGFEQGGRFEAVKSGLETASKLYSGGNHEEGYWNRHRHIMSALHQTLEQKDGEEWDFEIFSNLNYTQTVGTTIQYSEIKVATGETTENGNDEYAIINGALSEDMNHATHIPGEEKGSGYKRTMWGVRDSSNHVDLPPHDTEAIQNRLDSLGSDATPQRAEGSWASAMGYQLFTGSHEVNTGFEYQPDEMLVPATQDIHDKIDEIGYEQGDELGRDGEAPLATHGRMDLQLAVNEKYMNEGYDEVANPVVIDNLQETEDGWDFELREEPDWNWEQGYPAQAD